MSRKRSTGPERKKENRVEEFVPADPRCEQCHYWRYLGGIQDESIMCCHFALIEGKLRDQISKTECGSFAVKKPGRKIGFRHEPVPMSQWGCSGLGLVRKSER